MCLKKRFTFLTPLLEASCILCHFCLNWGKFCKVIAAPHLPMGCLKPCFHCITVQILPLPNSCFLYLTTGLNDKNISLQILCMPNLNLRIWKLLWDMSYDITLTNTRSSTILYSQQILKVALKEIQHTFFDIVS